MTLMLFNNTFIYNNLLFLEPEWAHSESIPHEAEAWMICWLRGHEGERNNNYCFSEIQEVGQK